MAIFYQHIKGLDTNGVYSYINWTGNAPTFAIHTNNSVVNYGKFLIEGQAGRAIDYSVYSNFTFNSDIKIYNTGKIQWKYNNVDYFIQFINDSLETAKATITTLHTDTLSATDIIDFETISSANGVISSKRLTTTDYCQAKYFNSTSDLRAKREVKNAAFDALDIIKNVSVKCFQYQDEDEEAPYSIGIIAQDVLDYPADKFELVNNPEASGVPGDYMTIKESKLVYILWKALQEQQEEIEELTETIKQMKKDLN